MNKFGNVNNFKFGLPPPNHKEINMKQIINTKIQHKECPKYCVQSYNPYALQPNQCHTLEPICENSKPIECKKTKELIQEIHKECIEVEKPVENEIPVELITQECQCMEISLPEIYTSSKEEFEITQEDMMKLSIKPKFKEVVKLSYKYFLKKDIPDHWD